ncbi:aminotransferase class III-fold pyridoxal phosphate-dependent enzyme, partial [Salibacteraceae bacterium]|nr:aminotransferase class III-fold pyridoxal phosphate-dependent enzyme [Salibacteraceae bacterium]
MKNFFAGNNCSLLPNALNTVYPLNSGTEAIEAALKIAKRHTGRSKIISFTGAYHGNTHGSMSVSSNEYKKTAFRPLLPGVEFLEWNSIDAVEAIDTDTACV